MRSISVSKQLALLGIIFLGGFAAAGLLAFATLEKLKVNGPVYKTIVQQKDLIADILPPPEYLIESYLVVLEMREAEETALAAWIEKSRKLREEYETRHRYWQENLSEGRIKDLIVETAFRPGIAFLELRDQQYIPALLRGDRQAAAALLGRLSELYREHRRAVDELVVLATQKAAEEEQAAADLIALRSRLLIGLALAIVAAVLLFSWVLGRNLLRQLGGEPAVVVELMHRVADGDLSVPVAPDDNASILAALATMQTQLRDIIGKIRKAAGQVSEAAARLSVTVDQVEATASQEVTAATSMAAAVEQLTASIGQIAEHASQAQKAAMQSDELSSAGGDIIRRVVTDMQGIAETVAAFSVIIHSLGDQSEKIFSIVKVIKDIADQTNLLALNAAIEAARAGEQGRGFAVVADEVRGLAARTAASIQEITGIVGSIQDGMKSAVASMDTTVSRVNQGVALVNESGESIIKIKYGAQQVVNVVEGISQALHEESKASNEVAANVEKIADMSEQNHMSIEETAGTARDLAKLAEALQDSVAKFRLEPAM